MNTFESFYDHATEFFLEKRHGNFTKYGSLETCESHNITQRNQSFFHPVSLNDISFDI